MIELVGITVAARVVGGPDPDKIMRETWGHLDAAPDVEHAGVIVFAGGLYGGEQVILSVDFADDTAGYGPWFYEHVHEWLSDQPTEPGTCYRWTGTYTHDGDHHYAFTGETTVLYLTENPGGSGDQQ